jgi:hypothetical protein
MDNYFNTYSDSVVAVYGHNITYDSYNHADPLLYDNSGVGFEGQTGNIVAAFRNNDANPFHIRAVNQSFYDTTGGGNRPYKIVIYGDNGSGKPGSLLYISPLLLTPSGTNSPQNGASVHF